MTVVRSPGPGRPKGARSPEIERGTSDDVSLDISDVVAGVTVTWLATVFRMGTNTVKRKLADCPVLQKHKAANLYDLKVAVQYLVQPKVDVAEYIKSMNPRDLPPMLQRDFWDAQNKRIAFEEASGDLWRTEKVMEVLAEAFKLIKTNVQLWPDTIERVHGLTDDQRKALVECGDGLLRDIHSALVDMPNHRRTPNANDVREPSLKPYRPIDDDTDDLL